MRTQLSVLLLLMCQAVSFATGVCESGKDVAVITGQGEVLPDEYVIYFIKSENGYGVPLATDTIADGKFRLEVPVGEGVTVGTLLLNNSLFQPGAHSLFLTPGAQVDIEAVGKGLHLWTVKSNVPEQAEYEQLIDNSRDLLEELVNGQLKYINKPESVNEDEYWKWYDAIKISIARRDLESLKTMPVDIVWLDKALEIAKYFAPLNVALSEDMKTLYGNLKESEKNSPQGRLVYNYLYPESHIGIGDKFPETSLYDREGKVHNLSEFGGKWCLIDFWRNGCAGCIMALPQLRKLKEIYGDSLELVSLSLDPENLWHETSEKLPLVGHNWNEMKEDYGLFRRVGTRMYPTFLIVAPDGTIKDIFSNYSKLAEKMNSYMSPERETE